MPHGCTFKGFPQHFTHQHAPSILASLLQSPVGLAIVQSKGEQARLRASALSASLHFRGGSLCSLRLQPLLPWVADAYVIDETIRERGSAMGELLQGSLLIFDEARPLLPYGPQAATPCVRRLQPCVCAGCRPTAPRA